MDRPQLEVGIYQIADDAMLKTRRTDGTGWDWCWADWQRGWMDGTPNRNAYRCLPLTIANQTGWWIKNPVGFSATWRGTGEPGSIEFRFDAAAETWRGWINDQFGSGIITWNTPFLFRTKPTGSRLLICGPANYFKANAHPLTAIIESDWMSMSFTMNWKLMIPDFPVRFEVGEPLFQAIPLVSNACADLESAVVSYQKLSDDPELNREYLEWHDGRRRFHELKAQGGVKPDDWQKDYFQGRDVAGREAATEHMRKVRPPRILMGPESASSRKGGALPANPRTSSQPLHPAMAHPGPEPRAVEMSAVATRGEAVSNAAAPAQDPRPVASSQSVAATLRVDDEWRRWIAENLMLDAAPQTLIVVMTARGIAPEEAAREVDSALNSPYLRGSERVRNRLKKREWQLAVYRKINRLHPRSGEVERRHKLPRAEFLEDYYSTNRPVIITGMMDDWPALRKWTLDYFSAAFGDREVEVQMGRKAEDNYELHREKYLSRMKFADYVEKVRTAGVTNEFYLTANNNSHNKSVMPELWDDIVQIPEYLDGQNQPGGFFWFGPAGTITPFHHDLTNNFMAQAVGRKRVKLAPSWDLPLMRNDYHVYSNIDGVTTPPSPHPRLDEAQVVECILEPGEILFLPIGCVHFVEGLDITVTVSFTNFVFDNDFASFYTTYQGV